MKKVERILAIRSALRYHRAMKRTGIILALLLMGSPALGHSITGTVTRVIDGDTICVNPRNPRLQSVKVRLAEIDAPEKNQAFGAESTKALSDMILGKEVVVEYSKRDRYRRIIGNIYLRKIWINQELVARGAAWHYKKYSSNPDLAKAETVAREDNLGLWGGTDASAPWVWRKVYTHGDRRYGQ